MRPHLLLLFVTLSALVACDRGNVARSAKLGSTTSTQNSGILDELLQAFQTESGIRIDVITAGTGQALALGRRGDVDIVLVHARDLEDEFVESGHGINRQTVMWNDFVIAGPRGDPATIRSAKTAAECLKQIAGKRHLFVSRGDESGTHNREKKLWASIPMSPDKQDWYTSTGFGMGRCLLYASDKQGYVLVDRGTWLAFEDRTELRILFEGDAALKNEYGAILVNPARHSHVHAESARQLLQFLVSPKAQRLIDDFRIRGERLFHSAQVGG